MTTTELPIAALDVVRGRILDTDSHFLLPPAAYEDLLGPRWGPAMREWAEGVVGRLPADELAQRRREARNQIWHAKAWEAIGAEDGAERLEALDLLGLARQLVFPPVTWPTLHAADAEAVATLRRYNDLVVAWADGLTDRLRPAAQLPARDVAETVAEAERVLARGARAVELPIARPPAGLSPADPAWDPLWAALAGARAPLMLHVGGGGIGTIGGPDRSLLDLAWGEAPLLRKQIDRDRAKPYGRSRGVFGTYDVATAHIPAEVFLTALVLGGVLDRHPTLTVGVFEMGAQWVSGWVERLDQVWNGKVGLSPTAVSPLARKPSFYVRRQIRISPGYAEPVGKYIERDGLHEVYVFSSDYPHVEGGVDAVERFAASLETLGTEALERFFVTNAECLFAD